MKEEQTHIHVYDITDRLPQKTPVQEFLEQTKKPTPAYLRAGTIRW